MRTRILVDYWNFQLSWNERAGGRKCDWQRMPAVLVRGASAQLAEAGLGTLTLTETRVYAGYEAGREAPLKDWLHRWLDRQPGIRVFTTERHWREKPIHCRSCGRDHSHCPCGAAFGRAAEKSIDGRIVTDLLAGAWEGAFDVAILVSSDMDFIPAVEHVQAKNFKVVNAAWRGRGNELARVSWASFELDALIPDLTRLE